MNFPKLILLCWSLLAPSLVWAQTDVVGAIVGSVGGTVQDEAGEMVAPQGAVQGTIVANDSSGSLVASVSGTAATSGALGLALQFSADLDATTGGFVGMYTDKPGGTPDMEIVFTPAGDLTWSAQVAGMAASATGDRSYDLTVQFSVPQAAIFSGGTLPTDKVYNGTLNNSVSAVVPLVVPQIALDMTLNFSFLIEGSWTVTTVPLDDGSLAYTGTASGTFSGGAGPVSVTVPLLGALTLPSDFTGSFSGNLFTVSATELAFKGSWTASSLDQSFGGDVEILIPLDDPSSLPFSFEGTMPMATGLPIQPTFNMPLSMSGSFPLAISGS